MSRLYTPLRLDSLTMDNRLVRSATGEGAADVKTGKPTESMADFYGRLAAGGAGLIISGHVAVSPEGRCSNRMTAFTSDAFIHDFHRITEACHAHGVPIVCQLNHGGRQVTTGEVGIRALGPSLSIFEGASKLPEEELDQVDIERIITDFAEAARRCQQAGFDGVQIHAAHGYLVSQFNSPLTNRRQDRWGGDPERRRAFLRLVHDAIRAEVGLDYPILVKQNVGDFHPDGMGLDEAIEICRMLHRLGVAAIELSGGIAETIPVAFRAEELKRSGEVVFFEEECRRIRQAVSGPLILTGGIRTRATAERLLQEGICDAVGLCRPFIREPDLPRRWHDQPQAKAACISCGRCVSSPERCNTCGIDS